MIFVRSDDGGSDVRGMGAVGVSVVLVQLEEVAVDVVKELGHTELEESSSEVSLEILLNIADKVGPTAEGSSGEGEQVTEALDLEVRVVEVP